MARHLADRLVLLLLPVKINFVLNLIATFITISCCLIVNSVWFVANILAIHYCRLLSLRLVMCVGLGLRTFPVIILRLLYYLLIVLILLHCRHLLYTTLLSFFMDLLLLLTFFFANLKMILTVTANM